MLLLAGVLVATGCGEVRASSRSYFQQTPRVTLARSMDETASLLQGVFTQRGVFLKEVRKTRSGDPLYIFQAVREWLTFHDHDMQYETDALVRRPLGSRFFVRLTPGDGGTHVDIVGKPTFDAYVLCSTEDAEWGLDCDPLFAEKSFDARRKMTGREEAEFIVDLMRQLRSEYGGRPRYTPSF